MKTIKDYLNELLNYYNYSGNSDAENIEERYHKIKEKLEKLEERRKYNILEEMIVNKISELIDRLKEEWDDYFYFYEQDEMWILMQREANFSQKEKGISNKEAERILNIYYDNSDKFVTGYGMPDTYIKALDKAIIYEVKNLLNFNLNTSDFIKEAEQLLNDYNRGYAVFDKV